MQILKPIDAYNYIAPAFARISEGRRGYLDRIDRLVISQIPHGSRSLLDIGAGTGARTFRIAKAAGLEDLVLLEPSEEMRKKWPVGTQGWGMPAENLCSVDETFDLITCLWNVLGHISASADRAEVLRQCSRLLSPGGAIFIDVNHRYNMRQYGALRTVGRMTRDWLFPNKRSGDVIARWNVDGITYATNGHVFTDHEFCRLAHSASLQIVKRFVVDYDNGLVLRSRFLGNLLYCLAHDTADAGDGIVRERIVERQSESS